MKKFNFKSIVVLLLVLVITMSMMVACRPAEDEDGNWVTSTGDNVTTDDGTGSTDGTSGSDGSTDGTAGNSGTNNGGTNNGTTNNGGTNNGTTNNGGTNNGTTNNGGTNNGTTNNGGTNNGGTNNGGTNTGTTSELSENPLMNPNKATNYGAALSYDIESTGFLKSAKLSDLKGKTLTLYTSVDYAVFTYYTEDGTAVNSWTWMNKELKKLYGLTVKYVRCGVRKNIVKGFQAMSAGKDLDLLTTHVTSFPYMCNILAPLEDYCNMSKLENSPGLDPQITALTRWKGKELVLGPMLTNGVLLYNASYIKSCGLDDPYELWKKGEWNWTNFKKYMTSLPKTTSTGQTVYGMGTWGQYWYWANTNGKACFEIDGDDPNGGIINNFDSAEVKETYVWLESVMDAGGQYYNGDANNFFYNEDKTKFTVMYYGAAHGVDLISHAEWAKTNEVNWVPFPNNEKNSNSINHIEIYGYGIGLPRKTSKENCRQAAAMFMELWCNRYTERNYDKLRTRCGWTHEQIVELYNLSKTNGRFGLGSGVGDLATYAGNGSSGTKWNLSITDATYSTATCMEKLSNYAKQEVANVLKFGVQ